MVKPLARSMSSVNSGPSSATVLYPGPPASAVKRGCSLVDPVRPWRGPLDCGPQCHRLGQEAHTCSAPFLCGKAEIKSVCQCPQLPGATSASRWPRLQTGVEIRPASSQSSFHPCAACAGPTLCGEGSGFQAWPTQHLCLLSTSHTAPLKTLEGSSWFPLLWLGVTPSVTLISVAPSQHPPRSPG